MTTKVAISIWDYRVSPVMDTACHLLLVEISDGHEVSREKVGIPAGSMPDLANFMTGLRIDILICGALSYRLEKMLTASGVKVYPWFRGDIDEIIAAYTSGTLEGDNYLLPGRRRRRMGRGRRCGQGAGFHRYNYLKEE